MSQVVLVDTSVFCDLLDVHRMSTPERHAEAVATLGRGRDERWVFLLPWATVLETGNHIGQVADGHHRRVAAQKFVRAVRESLAGTAPWSPAQPLDERRFEALMEEFEDWSLRNRSGLGDLSIRDEWERQCRLNPRRRVRIWSRDQHLLSFDQVPR